MTSLLCASVVQITMALGGTDAVLADLPTYEEAYRATNEKGTPMMVMVGTDWCPPCQTMKNSVLPRISERGLLRKIAFTIVNPDRDRELARQITGGGPIPQLVMFRRTSNGWKRDKLVGGQSVEKVEQFIKEGLEAGEEEQKPFQGTDAEKKADSVAAPPALRETEA